jgi:DNA topoisomerase-1
MSKLVIVESPAKIKKLGDFLGKDYIVLASVGHIIDLAKNKLSFDLETFEPEYEPYPEKADVIKKIKNALKNVDEKEIYLASDLDREGEAISWSIKYLFKLKNPKRIIFNSITKTEILKAIKNPTIIDMNSVNAQQTRRILDRICGYCLSGVLSRVVNNAKSAGRTQSVVTKLIVDKENEIIDYYASKNATYYYINVDIIISNIEFLTKLCLKTIKTINKNDNNSENSNTSSTKKNIVFKKEQENIVIDIIKNIAISVLSLLNINSTSKFQQPSEPFTTSTLQQAASTKLSISAKKTMSIAQKLYENSHITYMRTDSTSLSEEAMKNIEKTVKEKYGDVYYKKTIYEQKNNNTQEAHEAIRPTHIENIDIEGTPEEKKLYNLIWKRTIQSQMKPAEFQTIKIEIDFLKNKKLKEYKLCGTIDNLIFVGFLIVDGKVANDLIDIEILKKDINFKEIKAIEDIKNQPPRYDEASLVKKIDPKNLNIGRPSTYATLMNTIVERNYVEIKNIDGIKLKTNVYLIKKDDPEKVIINEKEISIGREKNKFIPTELGIKATEFLNKNFSQMMDYHFTANMEKDLDKIANGEVSKISVIKPFYDYLQENIKKLNMESYNNKNNNIIGEMEGGLKILNGKFGHYVNLNGKNITIESLYESGNEPNEEEIMEYLDNAVPKSIGKIDDKEVILKNGKFGHYVTYNEKNINVESLYTEDNTPKKKDILKFITSKLENKVAENNNASKEWKIGKKNYKLNNGNFGYYLTEFIDDVKGINISIKFLLQKITKDNDCETDEEAIELITKDDVKECVKKYKEYLEKKA